MIPPLHFSLNLFTRKWLLGYGDTTVTGTPHPVTVPHPPRPHLSSAWPPAHVLPH